MPFGLLTGLTAALFWGTLDVITALGSRVIGSLRVTAGIQSVVIRGESLSPLQAFGAVVATVGVLLTALAFDGGLRATRFAGPGVIFAVVALVLFSLMAITTDVALETMTWIQTYTIARVVNASIGTVTVLVLARRAT